MGDANPLKILDCLLKHSYCARISSKNVYVDETYNIQEYVQMNADEKKQTIRLKYGDIALSGGSCCCSSSCCSSSPDVSKSLGYSDDDVRSFPDANLGLGCGNPLAFTDIKEGDVVLDLGSGAGFDCFLAAGKVGKTGKVIGVDMTGEMVEKSRENSRKYGYDNTEFRMGDIEDLPVGDSTVDVIISNCVINLVPDKEKVFRESYRVLKPTGRMYISDMILLKELPAELLENKDLLAGCVAGAILKDDYIALMQKAGFRIEIIGEDTKISIRQYNRLPVASLRLKAWK